MGKYDNIKIDTHTHTLISGHAYHTLDEMINEAKKKSMDVLCITEHGPAMPGSCHLYYFTNYMSLKDRKEFFEELSPIDIYLGAEANIMNMQGELDMDLEDPIVKKCMDIVIASIHNCCFTSPSAYVANLAMLNVIKNPNIHIIGHPDDRDFNYEEIVLAAKEYGKILELNNSSNNPSGFRSGARERDLKMLELCKKHQVPISLASDAHTKYDIGNFNFIIPILEEVDFPLDLIINSSKENFEKYIKKKL